LTLPEGESELIAGFLTEYSGFKYALFFLGEYLGLFAVTGLAVTLFLGGWQAPAKWLEWRRPGDGSPQNSAR
jgi:NADH-quinone oxidoreductase subunit H